MLTISKRSLVMLVFLLILLLRVFWVMTHQVVYRNGQEVTVAGRLLEEPIVKANGQQFRIAGILVLASKFPEYTYGDCIRLQGKITYKDKTSTNESNNQFSTRIDEVLGLKRQDPMVFFPKIGKEGCNQFSIVGLPVTIRKDVVIHIQRVLPVDLASLFSGIIFGSREGFTPLFKESLRNTGTLHIVAASGMNVTLLAAFIMAIVIRFVNRRVAAGITIVAILFYAALASFQPSIVRAAIMGILAFTGSIAGRQANAGWGIVLAVYSMLFYDPFILGDIGFQLSVAATAGLIFLKPVLEGQFRLKHFFLGEDITTTLIAQIATLPILLGNFGTVSFVSVLVNTLVLWMVPILMVLGGLFSLVYYIPIVSNLILFAALPFLATFQLIILFFNKPLFLFHFQMPFLAGVGYYFLLFALYLFLKKRK